MSEHPEAWPYHGRRTTSSSTTGEIGKALSLAQAEIKPAAKSSINPAFKRPYSNLKDVWDACREALAKQNLAVTQLYIPTGDSARPILQTMLLHPSGEWLSSEMVCIPKEATSQGLGSAGTYARRYELAAMVGVAPEDDDDDGAEATAPMKRQSPPPRSASSYREPREPLKTPAETGTAQANKLARVPAEYDGSPIVNAVTQPHAGGAKAADTFWGKRLPPEPDPPTTFDDPAPEPAPVPALPWKDRPAMEAAFAAVRALVGESHYLYLLSVHGVSPDLKGKVAKLIEAYRVLQQRAEETVTRPV